MTLGVNGPRREPGRLRPAAAHDRLHHPGPGAAGRRDPPGPTRRRSGRGAAERGGGPLHAQRVDGFGEQFVLGGVVAGGDADELSGGQPRRPAPVGGRHRTRPAGRSVRPGRCPPPARSSSAGRSDLRVADRVATPSRRHGPASTTGPAPGWARDRSPTGRRCVYLRIFRMRSHGTGIRRARSLPHCNALRRPGLAFPAARSLLRLVRGARWCCARRAWSCSARAWLNRPVTRVSPLLTLCHHAIPASLLAYSPPGLAETRLAALTREVIDALGRRRAWLRYRIPAGNHLPESTH